MRRLWKKKKTPRFAFDLASFTFCIHYPWSEVSARSHNGQLWTRRFLLISSNSRQNSLQDTSGNIWFEVRMRGWRNIRGTLATPRSEQKREEPWSVSIQEWFRRLMTIDTTWYDVDRSMQMQQRFCHQQWHGRCWNSKWLWLCRFINMIHGKLNCRQIHCPRCTNHPITFFTRLVAQLWTYLTSIF